MFDFDWFDCFINASSSYAEKKREFLPHSAGINFFIPNFFSQPGVITLQELP